MDKGAKIEYNTLMRKNEEGVALVRKKSGFENLVFVGKNGKPITEHSFQVTLDGIE